MTRPRWVDLDERERAALQTVYAFLRSRLAERQSIEWALRLSAGERAKRAAALEVIERESRNVSEPWRSAWRLIEEYWSTGNAEEHGSTGSPTAKKRLAQGDRSGAMTQFITELVAPRLKLEMRTDSSKRPRSIHDLLSIRLTSGTYVDPAALGISAINEPDFLASLALALESALAHGLECARRTGWDGQSQPWQIGSVYRVYHVSGGTGDPDKYHVGVAPCAKLLHEIVARLAALQSTRARDFVQRWRVVGSPLHVRLWAALARDATLIAATDVAQTLTSLDDEEYWSLHYYPELAELRARRFADLDSRSRAALTARIRRLPPRRFWRSNLASNDLQNARTGRAIEELRRIQTAGGPLSKLDLDWMTAHTSSTHSDIPETIAADYGFAYGVRALSVGARPDRGYDVLTGVERLQVLETALTTAERSWDDNPAQRAFDWFRENNNPLRIVTDLEALADAGAAFPTVWNTLGSTHQPPPAQDAANRNEAEEARRVLTLLKRLPDGPTQTSIDGIAQWLQSWRSHFTTAMSDLWLHLWPMAVAATNARTLVADDTSAETSSDHATVKDSHMDMASFNTPAGQLVHVLFSACPNMVQSGDRPFDRDANLRAMRDAILRATGKARLIALHRLIEDLPYLMAADRDWAEANLIAPLNANDPEALALWHAIARETRFGDVIRSIGSSMTQRATDPQLSRETRHGLTFSLIIECLHALHENRDPAVPNPRTLQMLRSMDDESRVHAAHTVQRFLADVASETAPAEELFLKAVAPFLHNVWPQEQSLVTPGISAAFAKIPALAGKELPKAVSAVERFLVPFECWGIYEYNLDAEDTNGPRLADIDSPEKATSLLRLLDLTIGSSEGSIVPHELPQVLERICTVAPRSTGDRAYRRLITAARRA